MAEYAFLTVWSLAAPIDDVWEVIADAAGYPAWFPYVLESRGIQPGDEAGIGAVTRSRWRTALPYGFVFDSRTTRVEKPALLELEASGDLEGTGRWELSEDAGVTTVRYFWTVRVTKAWMNLVAPLARPAFGWNHAVLMDAGGEGLARQLGVQLVRNQSYTAESADPLLPLAQTAGVLAVLFLLARRLGHLLAGTQAPDAM
jgi:uncharacterized protein YndB with AHSA1/START domain